jgi:hypothetical protein
LFVTTCILIKKASFDGGVNNKMELCVEIVMRPCKKPFVLAVFNEKLLDK